MFLALGTNTAPQVNIGILLFTLSVLDAESALVISVSHACMATTEFYCSSCVLCSTRNEWGLVENRGAC